MAPHWNDFGAVMSSSPADRLWNGDEAVATRFHAGGWVWMRLPA
jgi:hypothetical protein